MKTIIVLPDGETWSTLGGCRIISISDEEFTGVCEDKLSLCRIDPTVDIDLNKFVAYNLNRK